MVTRVSISGSLSFTFFATTYAPPKSSPSATMTSPEVIFLIKNSGTRKSSVSTNGYHCIYFVFSQVVVCLVTSFPFHESLTAGSLEDSPSALNDIGDRVAVHLFNLTIDQAFIS